MKFWDWYLKIAAGSALIGGSMEFFMIKSGFCTRQLGQVFSQDENPSKPLVDDKVTVLESEKRVWDNSPEAQAMRDALNPWKNHDTKAEKDR